mgnify:CR=1 FL=1
MNGPIAQIVALTCHGNAFLAGHKVNAFFPNHSTCTFCDRVNFVVVEKPRSGSFGGPEVASTPDQWFPWLKSTGARGIRLWLTPQNDPHIPDRMSAGFVGGGGTWAMEVLGPKNRSEYWVARWEVWNRNALQRRIWRVTYGRVYAGVTPALKPPNLDGIVARLTQALREIHAFAEQHKCGGFTQCFANALDTLDSKGEHLHGYHKDLAPDGILSDEAIAILHACQSSWVFGGMGSWNDIIFDGDDHREYERVSEQLFQAVNEAIMAGANSSYYQLVPAAPAPLSLTWRGAGGEV